MCNMSYMWNEFNIKTFPAETIVYRDGVYIPDLSTIPDGPINTKYELPVHIIYIGEISGDNNLNINVNIENQPVYLSVNIKNKKPAFFNIFIENAGKNSEIRGHVILDNHSDLEYKCDAQHVCKNTTVLVKTKLIARQNSKSKLSGMANIKKNCEKCVSDINLSAISEKNAQIEFMPAQKISSVPESADHSASIYQAKDSQILYLRENGLGILEIQDVIKEAFINDFDLF